MTIVWETAVHLAVACDVYDGVFLCVLSFFPGDNLDEILNLIESVSDGFPTYSCTLLIVGVMVDPSTIKSL